MSSITYRLRMIYSIGDSIKHYKGYKVKPPEETISFIEKAFKDMGLKPIYVPNENLIVTGYTPFQSGTVKLFSVDNDKIALLQCEGKGVTPLLAKASGFAELAERFSGYGTASRGAVKYYLSIMKKKQLWLKKRELNKLVKKKFPAVHLKLYDMIPTEMRRGCDSLAKSICYSLTRDSFFCFPEELLVALEGSNGMASGNTLEEAIVHAICEYAERLGMMYLLDKQPRCNRIDRDSITHPTVKKLMRMVEDVGFSFEMIDLSFIFGIPIIAAIFDCQEWHFPSNPYTKVYCEYPKLIVNADTDPQDAVMRCFTEFLQIALPLGMATNLYYISKSKFTISGLSFPSYLTAYFNTLTPTIVNGNQPLSVNLRKYIKKLKRYESKTLIQNIESIYDVNLRKEIEYLVERLKAVKIEVFVHNITNPLLKLPTVRVFFTGGKGYFSKIPLVGYRNLILRVKDERYRYLYFHEIIRRVLTGYSLPNILSRGKWCQSHNKLLNEVIDHMVADVSINGLDPQIWRKNIEKFYFLGMLYLHEKKYKKAKKCFEASLYMNSNY
ncbi:MAG TPA: hypothetical protein ENI49_02450, partial [Thermoplasmatales archaeon]|nr:hypothetical protein [Thermoplasmatales archaeon]